MIVIIELSVPVEQIPYIRTIEGRKFHNGKWQFPDTAVDKLIQLGFISSDEKPKEKEFIEYELSPYLRSYQKDICNKALNCGSYGIFADTGTGKCYGKDTKILMYDGTFKNVQDICVGDEIMGDDSTKRNVVALTRGNATMCKIIPHKGNPFIVTSNHTLSLRRTNTTNHPERNGEIINITVNDYLKQSKTFKHLMKLYKKPIEFPEKDLFYDPYFIGLWLGDGDSNGTIISGNIEEYEISDYIKQFCEKYSFEYYSCFDKRSKKFIRHHIKQNKNYCNELKHYLTTKCLINGEKRVPRECLINSREIRLNVLAGLIDSDGTYSRGCFDIITKFEGLKEDIVFLAQSLGFQATTAIKKCEIKSLDFSDNYYRVCISGNIEEVPTKIHHKQATVRSQKKNVLNIGFEIERLPYDGSLYYGFETDGNHLHIIQDFFVQHNCAIGLELAMHLGKTIVLCPLSVIETAWIDDCHKFYPSKKIVNVWGKSKDYRLKMLNEEADIYVMNYESFKILRNEIRNTNFDCIIVDESSVMKNMSSQITSILLEFADIIPHKFVLSGCPTPNHNSEIFPQLKFVDSDLFGNNYYGFLARYFHQDMANPHYWYQTDEDKERYHSRLSEKSIFLKKEDCVDLPEKVFEVRRFDMAKKQRQYYDDIVDDIKANINQWSKFEFTAKLMKLREVASGFVINKNNTITDFDNNKEKLLDEVIAEMGNKPIIVWCQFQHEIETLAKKFNGVGLTSKTKNRDDIIRQFKNNEIKLLFTHPQLIGKGLTFVNCTYNIYYSLSFSYEEFKQSQDRIHRIGQGNKCTYIILQAKNSIEEKMYDCVQRKGSAVDELYLEMGSKTDY